MTESDAVSAVVAPPSLVIPETSEQMVSGLLPTGSVDVDPVALASTDSSPRPEAETLRRLFASDAPSETLIRGLSELPIEPELPVNIAQTPSPPSDSGGSSPGETDPGGELPVPEPPGAEPPGAEPPETEPPGAEPPGVEPPGSEPPETEPPGVEPPETEPPGVEPPETEPPETEPEPEITEPEATGEELPTVPQDETLVPTPSNEVVPPESLPPAVLDEEGGERDTPGAEPSVEEAGDPELGVLRLRERELSLTQPPIKVPVYLLVNSSYLTNSNSRASEDPVEDQLFRSTVSLTASPILGRRTAAYGTVQGNLFRYGDLSRLDYNEMRFRAGLRHVLGPRVVGELGWTHRQLFFREGGDRFLSDHSVFGVVSRRDSNILGKSTSLNSFYRVRASFADPKTSNRVVNTLGTTLSYDITPRFKASLTGLGVVTSFTKQSRHDVYGQVLANLSYTVAKNTRLSVFAALNRGGSVDERVDFDNALLGVSFSSSLKLF